ncbi:MAG: AMP-binding protein [Kiritimatiellaeota bacterium]|nr:AMP-binding protein [Kiritimatiellota bacterium]
MRISVLEYLEEAAARLPDKIAFSSDAEGVSFSRLVGIGRAAGTAIAEIAGGGSVAVWMERGPAEVAAFFSAMYAGSMYVPVDSEMGDARVREIIAKADPAAIICDGHTEAAARASGFAGAIILFSELCGRRADDAALAAIRSAQIDADPIYAVFTSGSSGSPKGVVACHRNAIDYAEALDEAVRADEETVFGVQAPLYLDACLKEILLTIKRGASAVFLPRALFSFPVRLIEYMNARGVNAVCWVASALHIVSSLGALDVAVPNLRFVAFGGERIITAQLEKWVRALPSARFVNLYGPTECTGMSCFYGIDAGSPLPDRIPIGKPFRNTSVALIGEGGEAIRGAGIEGEIYIRGSCVTLGYLNDPERTAEAFVPSPTSKAGAVAAYRTGDIAEYDDSGNLVYVGRADFQIKRMGYRVELAEIELSAQKSGADAACCVYDAVSGALSLFYSGAAGEGEIAKRLRAALPKHMAPDACRRLERLPQAMGGKTDRAALLALALWLYKPELLFAFPREEPLFWGVIMVCYPVASVLPQAILYRKLYERRYAPLFGSPRTSLLVGALAFSWGHLPFGNPFALLFTFFGGLLFLSTYRATRRLAPGILEHALYGNALFTIGWGAYLLHGTVALLR